MRKLLVVFAGVFALGLLVGAILFGSTVAAYNGIELPSGAWVQILLCFGVAGACGGVLASAQHADLHKLFLSKSEDHWSDIRIQNSLLALLISACGGVGGAAAALFVMLLDGKIKVPLDDLNRLSYITSGLLGGFIGFQLLKRVAEGFAHAAQDAAKNQVNQVVDHAIQEERKRTELSEAINEAMIALHNKDSLKPETVKNVIARLESSWRLFPDNRRAAILLGRLYRYGNHDLPKSVEVLTTALEAMKKNKEAKSEDVAAVHFNRACYQCLLAFPEGGAVDADRKAKCYGDLQASIALDPRNAEQARTDPDFKGIQEEPSFKQLVGIGA